MEELTRAARTTRGNGGQKGAHKHELDLSVERREVKKDGGELGGLNSRGGRRGNARCGPSDERRDGEVTGAIGSNGMQGGCDEACWDVRWIFRARHWGGDCLATLHIEALKQVLGVLGLMHKYTLLRLLDLESKEVSQLSHHAHFELPAHII